MYYYIPVNGKVEKHIDKIKISKLMNEISAQWEDESSPIGTVYMAVYDWAYEEKDGQIKLLIPNLFGGGKVPANITAQKLIGGVIYGDCFLLAKEEDIEAIDNRLNVIV